MNTKHLNVEDKPAHFLGFDGCYMTAGSRSLIIAAITILPLAPEPSCGHLRLPAGETGMDPFAR